MLEAAGEQGSVHEAELSRIQGINEGIAVPTWRELLNGAVVPIQEEGVDPSEFDRGWQCFYCSFSEKLFREQKIFPHCSSSRRAMLYSQSGAASSAFLRAIPSDAAFTMSPLRFQVAVRRRLRWALLLSGGNC